MQVTMCEVRCGGAVSIYPFSLVGGARIPQASLGTLGNLVTLGTLHSTLHSHPASASLGTQGTFYKHPRLPRLPRHLS